MKKNNKIREIIYSCFNNIYNNFFDMITLVFLYFLFVLFSIYKCKITEFFLFEFSAFIFLIFINNKVIIVKDKKEFIVNLVILKCLIFLLFKFLVCILLFFNLIPIYFDYDIDLLFVVNIFELLFFIYIYIIEFEYDKNNNISINDNKLSKVNELYGGINFKTVKSALDNEIYDGRLVLIQDSEIKCRENDLFDIQNSVETCRTLLNSFIGDDKSKTIGLVANWGYGKSSLINILKEENVIINYKEIDVSIYKNVSELYDETVNIISNAFNIKNIRNDLRNIKQALLTDPKTALLSTLIYDESITNSINDVNEEIRKSHKKLYIIFDNLDRANKEDIDIVLKIAKSIFNYNIIFILCYDKDRLYKIFNYELNDDKNFLDKYIDYEFKLPKYQSEKINKICFSLLNKLLKNYSFFQKDSIIDREMMNIELYDYIDKDRFLNIFFSQICCPRDLIKFINFVSIKLFNYRKYDVNLDIYDFLAITYIEYYDYQLYENIYRNKVIFIDEQIYRLNFNKDVKQKEKEENCKILFGNEEKIKNESLSFLHFMFNNLSSIVDLDKFIFFKLNAFRDKNNGISEAYAFYAYFDYCKTNSFDYDNEIDEIIDNINKNQYDFDIYKFVTVTFLSKFESKIKSIKNIDKYIIAFVNKIKSNLDSYDNTNYYIFCRHLASIIYKYNYEDILDKIFELDFVIYESISGREVSSYIEEKLNNNEDIFFNCENYKWHRFSLLLNSVFHRNLFKIHLFKIINEKNIFKYYAECLIKRKEINEYSVNFDIFKFIKEYCDIDSIFLKINKDSINDDQKKVLQFYENPELIMVIDDINFYNL